MRITVLPLHNPLLLSIPSSNSGVATPPLDQLTTQGYDLTFGTNVLGHYYLSKLLIPILERTSNSTQPTRIIDVAADGHLLNANSGANVIDYETLIPGKKRTDAGGPQLYVQSKSGNIIMSQARARILKGKGVASISLNPGSLRSHPHDDF